MAKQSEKPAAANGEATEAEAVENKVIWNDANMATKYSNVSNVATTSDEIMLLFGTSQAWNSAQKDVVVDLSDRIIMTPSTAKRFLQVLQNTLDEYEKNFGTQG